MWNQASIDRVNNAWFDHDRRFRRPLTGSLSFDRFPNLITASLTGAGAAAQADLIGDLAGQYDRVAFFFLDAFGWRFFEPALDRSPLLQRALRDGVIAKVTAQFPSTTTAHIPTIHYGSPVGQTGFYEWFCYEPSLDRLITPLTFSFAEDSKPNTLMTAPNLRLEAFDLGTPLTRRLADQGITPLIAQPSDLFGTVTARIVFDGAQWLPYGAPADGVRMLAEGLAAAPGRAYGFMYYELIDKACHDNGPASNSVAKNADKILTAIEERFIPVIGGLPGRTLVVISADHGQVAFDPARVLYLNELMPDLAPLIKRGAGDRLLTPAGSSRDLFLHIQPGRIDEAFDLLSANAALTDHCAIYKTTDLIDAGLFGTVSDAFRQRVGDIVVLPEEGMGAWWRDPAQFKRHTQGFKGHHGGLSPNEMDIPLIALAFGD